MTRPKRSHGYGSGAPHQPSTRSMPGPRGPSLMSTSTGTAASMSQLRGLTRTTDEHDPRVVRTGPRAPRRARDARRRGERRGERHLPRDLRRAIAGQHELGADDRQHVVAEEREHGRADVRAGRADVTVAAIECEE